MQFVNLAFLGLAASTSVAASALLPRLDNGHWIVTKVNRPTYSKFDQEYTMNVTFVSESFPAGETSTCTFSGASGGSPTQPSCDNWRFHYTFNPEAACEYFSISLNGILKCS